VNIEAGDIRELPLANKLLKIYSDPHPEVRYGILLIIVTLVLNGHTTV
jgi:hypothetical protein